MSRRPLTLLTICAFICATPLCMTAQNGEYEVIRTTKDSDFQPRADVEFEFPLADDLSFIINNEIRFMDNCTRVDRNYLLGAFSWETCDYFSIDAGYSCHLHNSAKIVLFSLCWRMRGENVAGKGDFFSNSSYLCGMKSWTNS